MNAGAEFFFLLIADTANSKVDTKEGEDCNNVSLSENITADEQDRTGRHPINFGELIEMIQKGIQLPDIEELNIEPTNEKPTPAQLNRPQKPWET